MNQHYTRFLLKSQQEALERNLRPAEIVKPAVIAACPSPGQEGEERNKIEEDLKF